MLPAYLVPGMQQAVQLPLVLLWLVFFSGFVRVVVRTTSTRSCSEWGKKRKGPARRAEVDIHKIDHVCLPRWAPVTRHDDDDAMLRHDIYIERERLA